jgi:hypothetical protein
LQVVDSGREGGGVATSSVDRDLTHVVEHPAHRFGLPERRRQGADLTVPHCHADDDGVHALS